MSIRYEFERHHEVDEFGFPIPHEGGTAATAPPPAAAASNVPPPPEGFTLISPTLAVGPNPAVPGGVIYLELNPGDGVTVAPSWQPAGGLVQPPSNVTNVNTAEPTRLIETAVDPRTGQPFPDGNIHQVLINSRSGAFVSDLGPDPRQTAASGGNPASPLSAAISGDRTRGSDLDRMAGTSGVNTSTPGPSSGLPASPFSSQPFTNQPVPAGTGGSAGPLPNEILTTIPFGMLGGVPVTNASGMQSFPSSQGSAGGIQMSPYLEYLSQQQQGLSNAGVPVLHGAIPHIQGIGGVGMAPVPGTTNQFHGVFGEGPNAVSLGLGLAAPTAGPQYMPATSTAAALGYGGQDDPASATAAELAANRQLYDEAARLMGQTSGLSDQEALGQAASSIRHANMRAKAMAAGKGYDPTTGSFIGPQGQLQGPGVITQDVLDSDANFGVPGYARGGVMRLREPTMGIGMMSGRPQFVAAEAGRQEDVRFTPGGLRFDPTQKPIRGGIMMDAVRGGDGVFRVPLGDRSVRGFAEGGTVTMDDEVSFNGRQGMAQGTYGSLFDNVPDVTTSGGTAPPPSAGGTFGGGGFYGADMPLGVPSMEDQQQMILDDLLRRQQQLEDIIAASNDPTELAARAAMLRQRANVHGPRYAAAGLAPAAGVPVPQGFAGQLPMGTFGVPETTEERLRREYAQQNMLFEIEQRRQQIEAMQAALNPPVNFGGPGTSYYGQNSFGFGGGGGMMGPGLDQSGDVVNRNDPTGGYAFGGPRNLSLNQRLALAGRQTNVPLGSGLAGWAA